MFHDLLFALSGFPGDIFCLDAKGKLLQVSDEFSFTLHPSELAILNNLAKIGYYYMRLLQSIDTCFEDENTNVYLKSYFSSLYDALEPYRNLLIEIEEDYITRDNPCLIDIQAKLAKYHAIFPTLLKLTNDIVHRSSKNVTVIAGLEPFNFFGIPEVEEIVINLRQQCHKVLYRQLISWMIYGELDLIEMGFFIKKTPKDVTNEWNAFFVSEELLPPYISLDLADKILFIGNSIKLLSTVEGNNNESMEKLMEESLTTIEALETQEKFNNKQALEIIESMRAKNAHLLWKIIFDQCNFLSYVSILNDVFFLMRDDLIVSIIQSLDPILDVPSTTTFKKDIQSALNINIVEAYKNEDCDSLFSLSYLPSYANVYSSEKWKHLQLDFNIPEKPLFFLFDEPNLNAYKNVFSFLFSIKFVQLELQKNWLSFRNFKLENPDPFHKRIFLARSKMCSLIDNLSTYFKDDVINYEYRSMKNNIVEKKDIIHLQNTFSLYLNNVEEKLFLKKKKSDKEHKGYTMTNAYRDIFSLCLRFCSLENTTSDMENIIQDFDKQYKLFFTILTGLSRQHTASAEISSLLMRLKWN